MTRQAERPRMPHAGHGPARVLLPRAARGLSHLLAVWLLAYVVLLQSVLGAAAMAAATLPGSGTGVLCLSSAASPDGEAPAPASHDGAPGLHCAVCPAAGGLAALPPAPALPQRFEAATAQGAKPPADHALRPLPPQEQARPRAPPAA